MYVEAKIVYEFMLGKGNCTPLSLFCADVLLEGDLWHYIGQHEFWYSWQGFTASLGLMLSVTLGTYTVGVCVFYLVGGDWLWWRICVLWLNEIVCSMFSFLDCFHFSTKYICFDILFYEYSMSWDVYQSHGLVEWSSFVVLCLFVYSIRKRSYKSLFV